MLLAEAIKHMMSVRGLRVSDVASRMAGDEYAEHRGTFYRLLSGTTREPRLVTLINLCKALETSPTELLQMVEVWPYRERTDDLADRELRATFTRLQSLPSAEKVRVADLVASIAEIYGRERGRDEKDEHVTAPPS